MGSLYRRERPQKGRFRQFNQFGIEAFGSEFPEQDAEIISMAYFLYTSLNIKGLKLKLNSIGSKDCRVLYKKKLQDYFSAYKDKLTDISKTRLKNNPLRILDTKVDFEIELIKNAPKIIDCLSNDDKEHFKNTLNILDELEIPYEIDDYLVRGLDYYSKTVFEIQADSLGAQNALCGGGRYDYLVEELGGDHTPAVGFAAGFERLLMLIDLDHNKIIKHPDIYIIALGDKAIRYSLKIANILRKNDTDLMIINNTLQRSLKSQLKDANRLKASYTVIIGENEMQSNTIDVKNMETGEQEKVPSDKIVDYFK